MSTIMDYLRNQCGPTGDEAADLIESLDKENDILREERDVITKERDELRDQVRQHEAFQQFANASEQQRLNDARREGFIRAREWAARICWTHDMDAKQNAAALGWSGSPAEAIDCVPAIRAMQPPAEWASS